MLRLDPYCESILFQCDRCRHIGELITEVVEDEGFFYCWGCLAEMNRKKTKEVKKEKYAIK